jgi:hypothetical protein
MNRTAIFIGLFLLTLSGYGQNASHQRTVAEERVHVTPSSATVLQWFQWIEKKKHITLSYNSSQIDLSRTCRIKREQDMSVSELLEKILEGYQFRTTLLSDDKLLIQIIRQEIYCLSGTVTESGSGERLYGAAVTLENQSAEIKYTLSDENGIFRLLVPEGHYKMKISYMGYQPYERSLYIRRDSKVFPQMSPLLFELEEVTVKSHKQGDELDALTPASLLSFSGNDLFSQIWILPGVTGTPSGDNFQVNGGSNDENLLLLDGVPVYHPGHLNTLFPVFNGDAVKSMVLHKGYFPARFEGRLSSITEIKLKEGNKQEHVQTVSLDMPAASVVLEGPIIKQKLSYLIGVRRSWLDLFDELLSEENRMNHSSADYNAKLTYAITPSQTLEAFAYGAKDEYHVPTEEKERLSLLRWNNESYQLRYSGFKGRLGYAASVYYTSYSNRVHAAALGYDEDRYIQSGINSTNVSTEFNYSSDAMYNARWGVKYSYDRYELTNDDNEASVRLEPISQFSLFYDNHLRINDNLTVQVGVNFIGYIPRKSRSYYSIQPRFLLQYSPSKKDMLYLCFSKMEQFYHYLRFGSVALPTDFRMPSIDGYKPRSADHYEAGWKHYFDNGQLELSAYYKTRRNIIALHPDAFYSDAEWKTFIMTGSGYSYSARLYFQKYWKHWMVQFSYTYARSMERFNEFRDRGDLPSLFDIPHQWTGAVSYKLNTRSSFSLGGLVNSGKIIDMNDWEAIEASDFRKLRRPLNYRIDVGYTYKRDFGNRLLLFRCGLYNVVGNPTEEELLNFYSVSWGNGCLPYGGISFRF